MDDQLHDGDGTRLSRGAAKVAKTAREKLRELCECDEVVADEEVRALGRIDREALVEADDNVSSDEVDEILEAESRRLNDALDLPVDTYSLTRISPKLPTCVRYGVRSGLTHRDMPTFSPLSRGLQGSAVAIAAFATTAVSKARCWNEMIIDRIVDDGDTYYCESYERLSSDDRAALTVLDLKRDFVIQNTHRVHITIDDPAYAGTFRSASPTDLHLAKALELFFQRYDAGVLTSPRLNISMWKDSRHLYIFDGQPRRENLLPATDGSGGSAKLIVVRDLTGLLFVILEKSDVKNEHFVLYGLAIRGLHRLPATEDDPEEPEKTVGRPRRRPSGYKIQDKYRALVRGSFHLNHEVISPELRGRGHLVIALAALIYSRLVSANKWTTAMIDLIFNQAHIYLVDLARVLEKKLDETFELKIDDAMSDVILGVYAAKVNVQVNVVPGQAKKGKATIDTGVREFFAAHNSAILEIKKTFYAVWKDGPKYYLLDPFGCDDEGFRVEPDDPETAKRYKTAVACVTMNSTINELIETILENTGNKEKDPFVMHGLRVMYVKTGTTPNGPLDTVIYREKKTNRRPLAPEVSKPEEPDECKIVLDTIPKPRPDAERTKEAFNQYPELMRRVEVYAMRDDEPTTFVESEPDARSAAKTPDDERKAAGDSNKNDKDVKTVEGQSGLNENHVAGAEISPEEEVKFIKGYRIVNPHRIILHGSKNCLDEDFPEASRGRQGLTLALTAMAYAKIKDPTTWRNLDVDQILRVGDAAHSDIVTWIRQGSREETAMDEEADKGEGNENEEEEEEGDEDDEDEEDAGDAAKSKPFKGSLKPAPNHIDVSMLPGKIKLGDNAVTYNKKMRVAEGDADPLANLGEALASYFEKYHQVILENKRLMYGIWQHDEKYFLFNPYGSDEEGWRLRDYPASLVVTDTINELTDTLHGVLEFNDRMFSLHFVGIETIQPGDKYVSPVAIDVPEGDTMQMYRTKFLPVTDQDLFVPPVQSELEAETTVEEKQAKDAGDEEDEDEEGDEEEDEEDDRDHEDKGDEETKVAASEEPEPEKPLEDPLEEVDEQERPDAPDHLNLSLLTGGVKIIEDEAPDEESKETLAYERLKYSHPPPYVLPPRKVLCVLLEAKRASRSMHSLISRFSIDSKLAVKAATDLAPGKATNEPAIATVTASSADDEKPVKMIKLPPTKYLFSRIPSEGFTPLRAIDEKFIRDELADKTAEEECRKRKEDRTPKEFVDREIPEVPIGVRITPEIVPLGPTIRTPAPRKKYKSCVEHSDTRRCRLSETARQDKLLEKMLCNTEDVLFDIIFPGRGNRSSIDNDVQENNTNTDDSEENPAVVESVVRIKVRGDDGNSDENTTPESVGFYETENNVGIIQANSCLENRGQTEGSHFKTCFFAAILCILTKVMTDVSRFRGTILDQFVLASDKIHRRTGGLRYKPLRRFRDVVILGAKCDALLRQSVYADPENCETDVLPRVLENYLAKNRTGILVLSNASYAFWLSRGQFHLFDPYSCDERGIADDGGYACLLRFCDLESLVARIRENNGTTTETPYRIYSLSIAHMEPVKKKKKPRRRRKRCSNRESEKSIPQEAAEDLDHTEEANEPRRESSLMELPEWVTDDRSPRDTYDMTLAGFAAVKNFNASALEVAVVENDITRPVLAPFRRLGAAAKAARGSSAAVEPKRRKPYDRKFEAHTSLNAAIDLCVVAWSRIHDPSVWGVRTISGIYEASRELAFDSLLAAKDSTVGDMTDNLLSEFTIGNYSFRAVFAPLHRGTLYAAEGWNLAMSLRKLFDVPIYSGAFVVCGQAHVGVTKRGLDHYAWWTVPRTKNIRIVTSRSFEDFLRLVVRAVGESEETPFVMRVVTISYARKLDPDCSDLAGLHEPAIPSTSLPQIHRRDSPPYDLDAMFRPTVPGDEPIFVLGTVAFRDRDSVVEPRAKRCYFVALLAVMVKRDIVQSPVPGMIDKVVEVAESLYREFDDPRHHTEHLLRNVTVMNRIFDFRDCASALFVFGENPGTGKMGFYSLVRRRLRQHLKRHTDGIIQFTNCCYGFWYSRGTNAYYYVDPYPCDSRGRRVEKLGNCCLCIFSSICQMARQMCVNRCEDTTGFFIHRLHVETINVPPYDDFREDPMWVYLDYHWSFSHSPDSTSSRGIAKRRKNEESRERENDAVCGEEPETKKPRPRPAWNNYAIEVPNLIYSVWGTVGCYDARFGERAGRNRAAICLAIMAMQYLCRPSRWSAAILDSGVMCGDAYYTESLKSAARRGTERTTNRFNLQPCFKVFPHIWSIDFHPPMCGILYGTRDRPCLATTLKLALDESANLVVECGDVTLGVLSCDDGFYVADPCWTGPPLFVKNHGAVYALRCRNFNALVYAVTKILNTNHRLEFRLTPVTFGFRQEICRFADRRSESTRKEILMDALGTRPGSADGPDVPVPGASTVPDEDTYPSYRRDVAVGLSHGRRLENPSINSSGLRFTEVDLENLISTSTAWHLSVGHSSSRKRTLPPLTSPIRAIEPRRCRGIASCATELSARNPSITEMIQLCDQYPRTIDFAAGKNGRQETTKILTRRKVPPEIPLSGPLDCLSPRKFLQDSSRREFNRQNKEMADEAYRTYKHRALLELEGDDDVDDLPEPGEDDQPMVDDEPLAPVESSTVDNVDE